MSMKHKLKKHKLLITTVVALADTVGKEYLMDKYDLSYDEINECYRQVEACPLVRTLIKGNTTINVRGNQ